MLEYRHRREQSHIVTYLVGRAGAPYKYHLG